MGKDTRADLVRELEALPHTGRRGAIIRSAKAGAYHDFKSADATPKHTLVRELTAAQCHDLARRVMAGEFDEEPDAADSAALRAEVGAALFDELMTADTPDAAVAVARRHANRDKS